MRWILLSIFVIGGVAMADTYRWVDENGVIHFSDRPHPGAELIELGEVQTFTAPELPPVATPAATGSTVPPDGGTTGGAYDVFRIVQPQPEETIRNNAGILDITIDAQPRIRPGHRVRIYLDGEQVSGVPRAATSFTIDGVVRGAHTLRATVEDRVGKMVEQSPTVRFFVQQTSTQNPNSPLNPNNRPGVSPRPQPRG